MNEQPSVGEQGPVLERTAAGGRLRHYTVTAVDDKGVTVMATYAGEATYNYTAVAWDRARTWHEGRQVVGRRGYALASTPMTSSLKGGAMARKGRS